MDTRLLKSILVIIALVTAAPVFAQDVAVEVNLGVLKDYEPPPMFDAPLTAPPVEKTKPALEKPKVVAKAKVISKPPVPPRRPKVTHAAQSFIDKARAEYLAAQEMAPEDAVVESTETIVPPPSPAAPMQATQKTAERPPAVMTMKDDALEAELMNPTVQEILASIDDAEKKRPKAAPEASGGVEVLPGEDSNIKLGYLPGIAVLPTDMREFVLGHVKKTLKGGKFKRIEIQAFASPIDQNLTTARRISLARAIEIQDLLVGNAVKPEMIDIRPLGNETRIQPVDRAEILFMKAGE